MRRRKNVRTCENELDFRQEMGGGRGKGVLIPWTNGQWIIINNT